MRSNEPLSNRAYFHPSTRKNFISPQHKLRTEEARSPEPAFGRTYLQSQEFEALQTNIRNTISLKLQREYEQTVSDLQRENTNLKQENSALSRRLNEFEDRITGLHTQLEVKKAVREGRRANLKMLRVGGSERPIPEEFERAAEIYEGEISRWKQLYEEQLRTTESLKVQLTKSDANLDSLVADYLTEAEL